ncbi:MAG: hypothetical protein IIA08_09360 [Proteobacteria bacterium]|nr:hypothetical protein [Pseudomonadota bacterium]
MSKFTTMTLTGASGQSYEFGVYPFNSQFSPVGAAYYISKRTDVAGNKGSHISLYFGQTDDLSTCLDDYHKKYCFAENGANCVGLHLDNSEETRREKEQDLINALQPLCND